MVKGIVLETALAGLAAAAVLPPTPAAAADEPPWQPATDLYAHMTGDGGDSRLDEAVRDLVTDVVEASVPEFAEPLVSDELDAAMDDALGDGQEDERADEPPDEPPPDDAPEPPPDAAEPDTEPDTEPDQGGWQAGDTGDTGWQAADARGWEPPRFSGHPVAADAWEPQAESCARAGGALVEVREHSSGQVRQLGVACVPPEHARPDPRAVLRDQAERRVRGLRLPGGTVTATPAEGLARLPVRFRVGGTSRDPATLTIHGKRLRVAFTVVAHRWRFGDGTSTYRARGVTTTAHAYRRLGRYRVTVVTVWTARVTLDGAPLTTVHGLLSKTTTTFPVGELRAVLTK